MRLGGYFLFLVTFLVYFPSINGDFIWDDEQYIKYNPLLASTEGLRQIWFNLKANSQYYPLTFTTFWIEFQLWGLWTGGYHIVNIVLHGFNAILLWLLCSRLGIPGAWFAATVFAIHPVHVDSVAQISERKNVLSLLFYLSSLLMYVRFANLVHPRSEERYRSWVLYSAAVFFFICALLSKTTACSLPAVILLLVWWKTDRGDLKWDLLPLVPFFVIGFIMSGVTVFVEQEVSGAIGSHWEHSFLEKILIAGRAVWFYISKLFWPTDLMLIYPKWDVDVSTWWQYLFPAVVTLALVSVFLLRNRLGKAPAVALAYFLGNLIPALGFFHLYFMRYSFVADHFQYLASISLITLAAALLWYDHDSLYDRAQQETSHPATMLKAVFLAAPYRSVFSCAILLCLGTLSWRHESTYANSETIWVDTLQKNPKSLIAHNNLGNIFLERKEYQRALPHYQAAVAGDPDFPEANYNLALTLVRLGRVDDAIPYGERAVTLKPQASLFHSMLGSTFWMKGDIEQAVQHFQAATRSHPTVWQAHYNLGLLSLQESENLASAQPQDALDHFERALELNPSSLQVAYLLAWTLATYPDVTIRDGQRAIQIAEQACQRTNYRVPHLLDTLAAAYAESGRFPLAVQTAQVAVSAAHAQQQEPLASQIAKRLEFYKASKPYHESLEQIRSLKMAS